jgi:hypothetical protein
MKDKIIKIEKIGIDSVVDITTDGDHLFFANGILTHNSGMDELEFSVSGIAGGISKAYSCDNMIAAYANTPMKERGEIQFQFLKTRNSGGVGKKLLLAYDVDTLKIDDMPDDEGDQNYRPSKSVLDAVKRKKALTKEEDTPVFDNSQAGKTIANEKADHKEKLIGFLAGIKT